MIIRHSIKRLPAGITLGWFILINRDREYTGLVEHELVHVQQFKDNPFLFYPRYLLSKMWRLHYATEAYAVSVEYGMTIEQAAKLMASDLYRGMVTYERALELLEVELNGPAK